MDQATTLRRIVGQTQTHAAARPRPGIKGPLRVIAVTSGKGGVGKTNLVLNLCLAISRLGRRVFLLDADMGLANVDVLLGVAPRHTLEHVLNGQKELKDIVLEGPGGFKILPASSGISELSEMSYEQQMRLFRELSRIEEDVDYLFIDTGAGISSNVLRFNASANEVLVVANPEPTSITDAYALMKLLSIKYHIREFALVVNSAANEEEALGVYERLSKVCGQFLQVSLGYLGGVPLDKHVRQAVRRQRPFLELYPAAPASRAVLRLAALLDQASYVPGVTPFSSPRPAAPRAAAHGTPPAREGTFWDRVLHWKRVK